VDSLASLARLDFRSSRARLCVAYEELRRGGAVRSL
jgi:hypothetical protein